MTAVEFVAWTLYAAACGFAAGILLCVMTAPRERYTRAGFNVIRETGDD